MKIAFKLVILFTCFFSSLKAQKLTLNDLSTLCGKMNWEDVDQFLLNKNWTYYDSEKGSTFRYNTITWSFNKKYYDDRAQGWFYLYTYEGLPNKISYTVFNKESYTLIQSSIATAGFKLTKSEIEDNQIISTYSNLNYTLILSAAKREKNEYDDTWDKSSTTAYNITLIKKSGVYDPANGKKTDYYEDDAIKAEYTLVNGKLNGLIKVYYPNGALKKTGSFTNGIQNGLFKEYHEDGNIESEYLMSEDEMNGIIKLYYPNGKIQRSGNYLNGKENGKFVEYDETGNKVVEYEMKNGMKNGMLTSYKDGNIEMTTIFKDDSKNGQEIEYYFDETSGKLKLKRIVEYENNERNGAMKLFLIDEDKTEKLLEYENYSKNIKNGPFQDINNDSLIIGSYKDDELDGDYKVYFDYFRSIFGGLVKTDTSKLVLLCEGSYREGIKNGYWKNYDLGTLVSEGTFLNNLESGEWKYYYSNFKDENGNTEKYAKQLYLIQQYSNGVLEGKSTRFSFLEKQDYPCPELVKDKNPSDTCKRDICRKILETCFYKNGKLNGPIEIRDSLKEIVLKGFFKDNLKDGPWLQRFNGTDVDDEIYHYFQKGNYVSDKREGEWIQYLNENKITETFNYENDELHGQYVSWYRYPKPREKKEFNHGKLTELITYDSSWSNLVHRYELYDEELNNFRCKRTTYLDSTIVVEEFWVMKEKEIDHQLFELLFLIAVDPRLVQKGYKDGDYLLLNKQNQPIITGRYLKEDSVGLWTFYYYEQNVKVESNFINNKRMDEKYLTLNGEPYSGEFIYINNVDGIEERRKIKAGLRNGKTLYLDSETKKKIKKESYKNGELK